MPTGEQLRNAAYRQGYDFTPIYMEPRALAFLRAWPDVPEVLRPAYSRFYDAGLIFLDAGSPSNMAYPGQLRLTAAGHRVREVMIGKNINFFRLVDVFGVISAEKLANRERQAEAFIRLWRVYNGPNSLTATLMDWNYPDLRRYITMRLHGTDPGAFGYQAASAKLKTAIERLTFHVQMMTWRVKGEGNDLDDDIPF